MTLGSRRIPLTVIGGFLGAGKTTLLNHWLRAARGERIAVLVNDFGALNIDTDLIESRSGDTIALSNGCVCCQIGDDLSRAFIDVLASHAPFDAVVVEASGVSDPWRIAQIGLADPGLSLGDVTVLVDAAALLGHLADPLLADTMLRQLKSADLIVLNKVDAVDAGALARVRARVSALAPATPQFETVQAQVPPVLLRGPALTAGPGPVETLGSAHACDPDCAHPDHGDPAHGSIFQNWSARPSHLFDAAALRQWAAAPPAGLLRLKALLRTGESEWSELQFAGRHASLRRSAAPAGGAAAVVAIGLHGRLPHGALIAQFGEQARRRACAAPHGNAG
ncbi:CobW family GTP-binding protein [Verminephrobacter aporrectodeae]|uniref:CobW family GTP-binding protein n=1 Tax=Verminephrobacter aporrectodeae TaxID=1110389 RepID=UPI002243D2D0|nr:GTP-binding protein [Verminephrobacter aporrectodeae]MCW8174162.1 GTP-binding protein [Verminephrobacter aporrectodeae subsp. tuberculatae]MCW8201869.1 GTP-binding protein [Verminephrobacter aporrectodeae subsp. tuberculatae]